jgi:RHS repeat-associated protein
LNDEQIWFTTINADNYNIHSPTGVSDLAVTKGDRVFFRVGSVFNGSYDQVAWSPVIEYTQLPFAFKKDVNNQSYLRYDSRKDFKLSASQKITVPEKGTIRVESNFLKPITTDDVQLEIIREVTNPDDEQDPDRVISVDTILLRPYSWKTKAETDSVFDITVDKGQHLYLKVHSNTNVNWAEVNWRTRLYYTALDDPQFQDDELFDENGNPLIEFYPVVDYSMYNMEVRMSQPRKVWGSQDSVTVKVKPVVELQSGFFPPFLFDGNIYVSVKKRGALLYKDTLEVYHNQIVSEITTKQFKVLKNDSIYVEYHVPHVLPVGASAEAVVSLADLILVASAEVTANDTTRTMQAGFYKEAGPKRIFGSMYRQWGHFAYQANDETRATGPILQSELRPSDALKDTPRKDPNDFEDGNDLKSDDTYKPYDDKFIILVPMGKQQVWMGYDNDLYLSSSGESSSRMGDNDPEASATTSVSAGTGASAISKKTETVNNSYSLGASFAIGGASATFNDGKTKVISDYIDFNGDRYPDIVVGNNVQFTDARGGLSSKTYTHPDENNSRTTTDAMGYSLSASFTTSKGENGLTRNIGKAVFSIGDGKSSAGPSLNQGEGNNTTDFMWLDINGDGLPDRVSPGGVRLNLGYSFAEEEDWEQNPIAVQKGESTNEGAGLGISFWGGSISGGISLGRSDNKTTTALQDVNSDGLADIVIYQGNDQALKVRFNDGNGFAPAVDWNGASFISKSSSTSQSANVAFTAGLYIPPPVNIKITVNPSYSNGYGASRELAKFADVDGDGFFDYVTSNKYDNLNVSPSKIGRTNMLKEVKRPLGASFTMTYARVGNTYELPNSQWVLDSMIVRDGLAGDGVDSALTTFAYENGYYDRHEREFYGFGKVVSRTHNTGDKDLPVYSLSVRTFENKDYFKKGLILNEVMADGAGNKYIEKENLYELSDTQQGGKFPKLKEASQKFYEGQTAPGKRTRTTFVYNNIGNVTTYTDEGDLDNADDDLKAVITYHDLDNLYIKATPKSIVVNGGLRKRESVIDQNTGNIKQIKQYLNDSEGSIHDMEYDQYGNLKKITRPKNSKGQRLSFDYEYDDQVHAYNTKVTNSYGNSSEATYDYRFGQVLISKDLNENEIKYELDAVGRIQYVTGPYEKGNVKTIEFQYHLPAEQSAYAITKHYDPANPSNFMNTVILVDGLGRVVQTKKDVAIFDGEAKADKEMMSVSGRVYFDGLGRAIKTHYPTLTTVSTDPKVLGAFIDTPDGIVPTTTTYDVMNRTLTVTLPDGAVTTTEYGFNSDRDGKQQFSTKTTDANGKQMEQFTDGRERVTSVKNYTTEKEIWTSFRYNAINEQVEATDDLGYTTLMAYDNFGRRTQRVHPDAGTTMYSYDLAGNLKELVTENLANKGQAITYTYDFERLTEISYPENPENNVKYSYGETGASDNRTGRIVLQEDATGAQEFFYGPLGEVVKNVRTIVLPQYDEVTYTTEWKYDTWNRLTSMVYADGEEVTYTYNTGGLLRSMDGKKKNATFSYVKQLGYDKFEQRVFLAYGNGTKTTYAYEPDRRRLKNMQAQTAAKRLFMDNVYSYDKVNNILGMENKAPIPSANLMGGSSEYIYQYDDLYRLSTAEGHYKGPNDEHTYNLAMVYNSVGGITQKSQKHLRKGQEQKKTTYGMAYTYGEEQPHAPVHIGDQTYTYDANGNQTGWTSDKSGQRRGMMWDEENRLRSVNDNGAFYHYAYDAAGERVWKAKSIGQRVFVNGEWKAGGGSLGNYQVYVNPYIVLKSGGYTKHYYIEGQRIVSKLGGGIDNNGKGPLKAGDGKVDYNGKRQKVFEGIVKNLKFLSADGQILTAGKSGKIPPGQINGSTNTAEAFRYFYHPDHLGSTSYVTDASGEVYQHLEYFAFGETFVEEHSNTDRTPYLFNGKELDEETGLYYYGARYYDPKISVFATVDPDAEQYAFMSPFVYAANSPIKYVDVQGMGPGDPPKKLTKLSYSLLEQNFNRNGQSLLSKEGSRLNYLANKKPQTNTCAIKMSEAFNKSGYKIPRSEDTPADVRVQNGGKNDSGNFILDAESMGNYFSDLEQPTYYFKNLDTPEKVEAAIKKLHESDDLKGIIAIEAGDKKVYEGTGHVDLLYEDVMWDLSMYDYGGGTDLKGYLMDNLKAKLSIKVWVLEKDNND